MHNVKSIGVIGAGQMGGGIAQVAALSGFTTVVFDSHRDAITRCKDAHAKRLAREVEKGRATKADADAALARLSYVHFLEQLKDCDILIEAVVENAETKKQIFGALQKLLGNQRERQPIIATNTSSISITELAVAAGPLADSFIGMHFFNPVPVMKLVEVIKGVQTSQKTTERVMSLAQALGKTPVPAHDRPGFVSNRVLMPMINEAFYAWMEGVAEPAHIDEIMKLGCNFPMGPLRLADFIGLDTCLHIMDVLADGLNDDGYRACPLLKQLVAAGRLGDKTGRGVFEYPPPGQR
jgi:3-hydroxybutyryl-CoA dehydrogenase